MNGERGRGMREMRTVQQGKRIITPGSFRVLQLRGVAYRGVAQPSGTGCGGVMHSLLVETRAVGMRVRMWCQILASDSIF